MVKTKIDITPYVAEYLTGKYFDPEAGCVRFPGNLDLYVTIWDLLQKRPEGAAIDKGNLEFVLPDRREGKDPETYNYLSKRSAKILEKKMSVMMWAELHEFMDENKHARGIRFKDSAFIFLRKYNIDSISDDGILKNYQRWRDKLRKQMKRGYRFKQKTQK